MQPGDDRFETSLNISKQVSRPVTFSTYAIEVAWAARCSEYSEQDQRYSQRSKHVTSSNVLADTEARPEDLKCIPMSSDLLSISS